MPFCIVEDVLLQRKRASSDVYKDYQKG
jgi:hypothetical protein